MKTTLACVLALLVSLTIGACSNDPEPRKDTNDDVDFSNPKGSPEGNTNKGSGSGKSGTDGNGSKSGTDGSGKSGTGDGKNSGKDGTSDANAGKKFDKALARTEIEGKTTEFPHVIALWDNTHHAVRVVASTKEIPASAHETLRNGDPLQGEVPHIILSFQLEEGATDLKMGNTEVLVYAFYNLTSLSPVQLINIGKEAIMEFSGKAKVGEKVRVFVEFRNEKIKDAPKEGKFYFDFAQELELK
jgi:hypothetical protein